MKILTKALQVIIGLAVLAFIIVWMSGGLHSKVIGVQAYPETPKLPAGTAVKEVHAVRKEVFEEASGSVIALRRTAISSRIMATIKAVHVRAGDTVKEGDVLISLDDRDLQARKEQAQRSLEVAEAQRKVADSEYQRRKKLLEEKVISKSEFDQATKDMEVAGGEVERSKKALEEADVALTYPRIKSPVSGRIVDRLAEPGDMAAPGKPLLQIYDPRALQLEVGVRESLASSLRVGQPMQARIDALKTSATLEGVVQEIVPQSEAGSRVFRVKAALPEDPRLYTGMFGRLIIPTGQRRALLIPSKAVEAIGQNRYVVAMDEKNIPTRRMVTLGPEDDGAVEVLSGLEDGEKIAVPN
ncbi:MAG: efflux RND transporter periplasmic adaptor subunit [Candidatus Sumerlaeota bacterium]|nr:efflux RND transporter periplasmic adaptor subunit [Candidatus Sumerlaeota bacterium]